MTEQGQKENVCSTCTLCFRRPSSSSSSSSSLLSSSSSSSLLTSAPSAPHFRKTLYVLAFLVTANCLFIRTDACYLRNCPVGKWEGKRSGNFEENSRAPKKVCPPCGPANSSGRCMGPHICCIPGAGCIIGPNLLHTAACSNEVDDPVPCMPEGISCGEQGGVCGSEGVCCTEENCKVSTECTSLNPFVRRIMKTLNNF